MQHAGKAASGQILHIGGDVTEVCGRREHAPVPMFYLPFGVTRFTSDYPLSSRLPEPRPCRLHYHPHETG